MNNYQPVETGAAWDHFPTGTWKDSAEMDEQYSRVYLFPFDIMRNTK